MEYNSDWVTYADWNRGVNGKMITYSGAVVVVPPNPTPRRATQTIRIFNSIYSVYLNPDQSGSTEVLNLQTVLQWGPTQGMSRTGDFWCVYSCVMNTSGAIIQHTTPMPVSPNQPLQFVITGSDLFGEIVYTSEVLGIPDSKLTFTPTGAGSNLSNCAVVLEALGIQQRSDYPPICYTAFQKFVIETAEGGVTPSWDIVNKVIDYGQHTVTTSSEVDLYYSLFTEYSKVTLSDTSTDGPSLASLNKVLYIAWKSYGNEYFSVKYSTDNGRTFQVGCTSSEKTPSAPSLAAHNGNLYIAWRDGHSRLYVAQVGLNGIVPNGFSGKMKVGETSPFSPSLASSNNLLCIGWRGLGNKKLNVKYSGNNGASWGNKHTEQTSSDAPNIVNHANNVTQNNDLYIAWQGTPNNRLNVAQVTPGPNFLVHTFPDTSPISPAIASINGRIYMAWKGVGNNHLNIERSSDNGITFGAKGTTSSDNTSARPSLCAHNNNLYIGWKSYGNNHLNVAIVCL